MIEIFVEELYTYFSIIYFYPIYWLEIGVLEENNLLKFKLGLKNIKTLLLLLFSTYSEQIRISLIFKIL